jgi:c-di-GMP-binding flagellar brake protein YcgR
MDRFLSRAVVILTKRWYNSVMSNKERRKHPRIETDVTVEVYMTNIHTSEPEVAEICTVIDLSESGMRFLATGKFTSQQLLRLTFLLPDSIIIIRTDARIVHQRKGKGNHTEFGVEFTNISKAERKLIRHLVDKKLRPEPA